MLQADHAQEVADLKAMQQLELQESRQKACKYQAAMAELEKELCHLKPEPVAEDSQDNEPVQGNTQESFNDDVQVDQTSLAHQNILLYKAAAPQVCLGGKVCHCIYLSLSMKPVFSY